MNSTADELDRHAASTGQGDGAGGLSTAGIEAPSAAARTGAGTLPSLISSYLPDLVVRGLAGRSACGPFADEGPGAALLADVAGFTALADRLARNGSRGSEELTRLLNDTIGTLVRGVVAHGGDVVKFAGDALLAVWRAGDALDLGDACRLAAQCGLEAQQSFAEAARRCDNGLAMRIGVGSGSITSMVVGGEGGRWELLVRGSAVAAASVAESTAPLGRVVVSAGLGEMLGESCRLQPIPGDGAVVSSVTSPVEPPRTARPECVAPDLLRGLVPAAVLARFDAGQANWVGELRRVTALFISLPGLEEPSGLEQVQLGLSAVQRALFAYGGVVNKLSVDGKGQMAIGLFGLPPVSHEDDALRGVRAAVAIRSALEAMGWEASIGVSTGLAFCGEVGSPLRREYTVIGDVMNLAARLMQIASSGILCDSATRRAASARFSFTASDPVRVKGRQELVPIFIPGEERERAAAPATPLLGRSGEIEILEGELSRLAAGGAGGVVLIEGEPGIGKSRLVAAAVERAGRLGVSVLSGAGDSVRTSTLYHLWNPVFAGLLGLDTLPRDPGLRAAHLREVLEAETGTAELAPLLNAVLETNLPETEKTSQMSGQVRADNTRELLLGLLERLAGMGNWALVLDDIHWADSLSLDLLLEVARKVHPLAMFVSTRPAPYLDAGRRDRLMELSNLSALRLEGLEAADTIRLIAHRLGVRELPPGVARLVAQRTAGHPFFSEELAYSLRDSGVLSVEDGTCRLTVSESELEVLELPDTVQGAVMSRIDRLGAAQQMLLKTASVIGFNFPIETLHDVYPVAGAGAGLDAGLAALSEAGIVLLDPEQGRGTFKHAIVQDVAYNLLTFEQRRCLHRDVANWYEMSHSGGLQPFYALLAHHWKAAEVPDTAIEYLDLSAAQALDGFANEQALGFLEEAGGLETGLDKMSPAALSRAVSDAGAWGRSRRLREACREGRTGVALYRMGRYADSDRHSQRTLELLGRPFPGSRGRFIASLLAQVAVQTAHLALRPGRGRELSPAGEAERELARAYFCLVQSFFNQNDVGSYVYSNLCMLNLTERAAPTRELAEALAVMGLTAGMLHLDKLCASYIARALDVAMKIEELAARVTVLMYASLGCGGAGLLDASEDLAKKGAAFAEQMGDRRRFTECTALQALVDYHRGAAAAAREKWLVVYETALEIGDPMPAGWGACGQVETALRLDAPELLDACVPLLEQTLERVAQLGLAEHIRVKGLLASVYLRSGRLSDAARWADEAARDVARLGQPNSFWSLEGYTGAARVRLEMLRRARAKGADAATLEASARESCKALETFAGVFPVGRPRAHLLDGCLRWLTGRPDEARKSWQQGLGSARGFGMRYEVAEAHLEIAGLLGGEGAESREHAGEAHRLFEELGLPPPARR